MKTYDLEAASKTIAKNVLTPPLRTAGPTFCSAIIDRWLLEPEFLQKMLLLKSSFSEKATKIWKNLPLVLMLLSKTAVLSKRMGDFFQILWSSHNFNFKFGGTFFLKSGLIFVDCYVNYQNTAISLKPIHLIDKIKLILYPRVRNSTTYLTVMERRGIKSFIH